MKSLSLALVLIFTAPAFAATNCTGLGHGAKLTYSILPTRVGARVHAALLSAEGSAVNFSGLQDFGEETLKNVYQLADEQRQTATLQIHTQARRLPCGRGSCDVDHILTKLAELTYLGQTLKFTCHDSAL